MKKTSKILSAFLALVMAFALAAPAFAAESSSIELSAIDERWGNGTKLVLTNVVGQEMVGDRAVQFDGVIYDVAVGGGLDLSMEFPAGVSRTYGFRLMGFILEENGDFDDYWEDFPFEVYDEITADMGMDHYTITCTQAMVGKLIAVELSWNEQGSDGAMSFYIRAVNADGTAPAQPSTPATPNTPSTPSTATVVKPAPGVSVPLNNGANAYLGEYLYTVKSGDTLSKIADYYYGVPAVYELIYSYNKDILKSADKIYAGQTITLPSYAAVDLYLASAYPRESSNGGTAYVVKSGDSLSKIAKAAYGDATKWKVIYEANRDLLKSPSRIYPGQVLIIPAL